MNYGYRFVMCTGDRDQDHSQEKEMWDLPDPGIEPMSSSFQVDSLPLSHQGSSISRGLLFSVNFYYIFLTYTLAWLLFFKLSYSNLDFIQPLVLTVERNLCFTMAHGFSESFIVIFNLFDNVNNILIY